MNARDEIKTSWKPRQGGRCRVLPTADEERSGKPTPPGIWWLVSAAPESGYWWLHPHSQEAHDSTATFGRYPKRHVSTLRSA